MLQHIGKGTSLDRYGHGFIQPTKQACEELPKTVPLKINLQISRIMLQGHVREADNVRAGKSAISENLRREIGLRIPPARIFKRKKIDPKPSPVHDECSLVRFFDDVFQSYEKGNMFFRSSSGKQNEKKQ